MAFPDKKQISITNYIYTAFSQIWQKIRLVPPSHINLPSHPRRATDRGYSVDSIEATRNILDNFPE